MPDISSTTRPSKRRPAEVHAQMCDQGPLQRGFTAERLIRRTQRHTRRRSRLVPAESTRQGAGAGIDHDVADLRQSVLLQLGQRRRRVGLARQTEHAAHQRQTTPFRQHQHGVGMAAGSGAHVLNHTAEPPLHRSRLDRQSSITARSASSTRDTDMPTCSDTICAKVVAAPKTERFIEPVRSPSAARCAGFIAPLPTQRAMHSRLLLPWSFSSLDAPGMKAS
jgi:hypothetical protein